ncbi:MAG: nicotinate (nicotinamide) nucleotide adenylyltransferase [Ignavibacteriaceae bacterium]|nr:nicotinate (nicotinamide) nucleotide adenylyltransferase [Ignavibacteriaceae bacterium]
MKKIGIFGGTFDPIHFGHLITAQSVCEIRKLDKIIFVPSFISPHKTDRISSAPNHRLNMVKLAVKNYSQFDYSDIEIKNPNVSYTIDTIKKLKKVYSNIELIIGFDNLMVFDTWKSPDELLKLVTLVVLRRKINHKRIKRNKYFDKAIFVETPIIEIFGTNIRDRVLHQKSINFLVPQNVMAYIYKHNLYKEKF